MKTGKSVDILAIGNAIVDIQTSIDENFLIENNIKKGVMTLVDKKIQSKILSALLGQKINKLSGGSAANTIIGFTQLGGAARFIGKVGNDEYGKFYREDMIKAGVEFETVCGNGVTGTCVVLITPDAERTMLTCLGICAEIIPNDIPIDDIKSSKLTYIEGYLWDSPQAKESCLAIIDETKKLGKKVAFTMSDPFVVSRYKHEFLELTKDIDLIFCNLQEGQMLTGLSEQEEVVKAIGQLVPHVAMTLGKEGSIVFERGKVCNVPTKVVMPIDTNGAGDAFAGGFLYNYIKDSSLDLCATLGNCISGIIVCQMGARNQKPITELDYIKNL